MTVAERKLFKNTVHWEPMLLVREEKTVAERKLFINTVHRAPMLPPRGEETVAERKLFITINGACSLYIPVRSKFEAAVSITRAI